jgi:hypothetical protein
MTNKIHRTSIYVYLECCKYFNVKEYIKPKSFCCKKYKNKGIEIFKSLGFKYIKYTVPSDAIPRHKARLEREIKVLENEVSLIKPGVNNDGFVPFATYKRHEFNKIVKLESLKKKYEGVDNLKPKKSGAKEKFSKLNLFDNKFSNIVKVVNNGVSDMYERYVEAEKINLEILNSSSYYDEFKIKKKVQKQVEVKNMVKKKIKSKVKKSDINFHRDEYEAYLRESEGDDKRIKFGIEPRGTEYYKPHFKDAKTFNKFIAELQEPKIVEYEEVKIQKIEVEEDVVIKQELYVIDPLMTKEMIYYKCRKRLTKNFNEMKSKLGKYLTALASKLNTTVDNIEKQWCLRILRLGVVVTDFHSAVVNLSMFNYINKLSYLSNNLKSFNRTKFKRNLKNLIK